MRLSGTSNDSGSRFKHQRYGSAGKLPCNDSRRSFVELTQLGSERDDSVHKTFTTLSTTVPVVDSLDGGRGLVPSYDKNGVAYGSRTFIHANDDGDTFYEDGKGDTMKGIIVRTTIHQTRSSTDDRI